MSTGNSDNGTGNDSEDYPNASGSDVDVSDLGSSSVRWFFGGDFFVFFSFYIIFFNL